MSNQPADFTRFLHEREAASLDYVRGQAEPFLALAASGAIRSKYQGTQTSVEGFTWPDTYFVAEHESDEQILRTIVDAFDARADAAGLAAGAPQGVAGGRDRT